VPVLPPVKLAEHVAGLPLSVQLVLAGDTPAPLAVRLTVPVGVLVVPDEVSVTVMVQLLACPTTTGPAQLTPVVLTRLLTVAEPLAGPLPLWLVSPAYEAETPMVPVVLPVKFAEQLAEPPLPLSVQFVLVGETPAPLAVKLTLPVGVLAVPAEVSFTVAVQLVAWPMTTGLVQLTEIDVVRVLTVIEPEPELAMWLESPA
jgi:hypothetical protein